MKKIIEVKNLSFQFNKNNSILSNIDFSLKAGDILTILGANGSGKSTLLNCIMKILEPTSGEIYVDGINLKKYSYTELSKTISYVQQSQDKIFDFEVRDYIVLGLAPHIGIFSVPKKEDYKKVDLIIDKLHINHLAYKTISKMSGGERQLVQIARAIIQNPQILILDEPTNNLDYGNQIKLLNIITNLVKEDNVTVLMTTHMPDHALLLNQKSAILNKNEKFIIGESAEVITAKNLEQIYDIPLELIYLKKTDRIICVPKKI